LTNQEQQLYDNVDTDMIFHNRHLHITNVAQMGQHALGNLPGWEDFAHRAGLGDLIVAGPNFGAGSSRQQAVDCFRSLGIGAIIAESFGAIYKRNAINSGLPILVCPGLSHHAGQLKNGDTMEVDFGTGELAVDGGPTIQADPFSQVQMEIYLAGNLFAYGKLLERGTGGTIDG
jgi:3-isopropylmalate/(R)-2-methylmalate dehydratase small subunit